MSGILPLLNSPSIYSQRPPSKVSAQFGGGIHSSSPSYYYLASKKNKYSDLSVVSQSILKPSVTSAREESGKSMPEKPLQKKNPQRVRHLQLSTKFTDLDQSSNGSGPLLQLSKLNSKP